MPETRDSLAAFLSQYSSIPTQRTYGSILRLFLTQHSTPSLEAARSFLSSQREKGLSLATLAKSGHALRSYLRFVGIEWRDRIPSAPERIKPYLETEDIQKVLGQTKDPLEKALVMLLFDSAVRISELLALKSEDVDWGGFLRIIRKGGDEAWTPVGGEALQALRAYLKWRGKLKGALFPQGYYTIWQVLHQVGKRAGIHLTAHMLRHSRASLLREQGVELEDIKDLLGHKQLQTTLRYARIKPKTLKARLPPAFP